MIRMQSVHASNAIINLQFYDILWNSESWIKVTIWGIVLRETLVQRTLFWEITGNHRWGRIKAGTSYSCLQSLAAEAGVSHLDGSFSECAKPSSLIWQRKRNLETIVSSWLGETLSSAISLFLCLFCRLLAGNDFKWASAVRCRVIYLSVVTPGKYTCLHTCAHDITWNYSGKILPHPLLPGNMASL